MFWFYDYWYFILVLPAVLLTLVAQIVVKSTFSKYSRVAVRGGMTGDEASRTIQRQNGINVPIMQTAGSLTDHYDPKDQVIRLSEPVYGVSSVAAVGVAAHETGHALQYAEGYGPIRLRMAIVPVTRFASALAPYLVLLGLLLEGFIQLAWAGVILFGVAVVFQLVTLPVEFNASRRAMKALEAGGMLTDEERRGARRVLTAAAMTYVASLFLALMSLLRVLLIVRSRSRRR